MKQFQATYDLDGQKLTLQFGKLAQAVDTSVYATLGETALLVTVAVGPENTSIDYFPLSVEYVEKLYAGGIIKGSRWVKREGRPSDESVLISRLIDRSIRPLFPKSYKKQVQVVVTLLSVDGVNSPDILAVIATSAALHVSSVPWNGPISAMRIGYVSTPGEAKTNLLVCPTEAEQSLSALDLVVASTREKVVMIEAEAEAIADDIVEEGIELAKKTNVPLIDFISSLRDRIGKTKDAFVADEKPTDLHELIQNKYQSAIDKALRLQIAESSHNIEDIEEIIDTIYEELEKKYDKKTIKDVITKHNYANLRRDILENKKRPDGRGLTDIRPLSTEISFLPRTHGSALFQRGQTQILSIVTLGSITLEQLIEGPEGKEAKRYIHHYSDAPYSYGEVGRMVGPSRRAIGHGALAEKAVEPMLPSTDEFPYTIRVVSEILSENGSSSMGSVCGSSLALMDAGVPLKQAVAGIAMGMVSRSDDDYVVLTDIIGLEDFAGDMDFKIAGTATGITAIQLDVKNSGLTTKMIKDTFSQAKEARLKILDHMNNTINRPKKEVSKYAPKVIVLTPPPEKIGDIIGPGGKNIRNIIAKTQTDINISDDGKVTISGFDIDKVEEAAKHIENIIRVVEVGEEYVGEVKRILPFGAFVEILPGKEGLVHVSRMGKGFVRDPAKIVKIGQKLKVRVYQIDNQGRINLELVGLVGKV